jgi:hypothetical protein
MTSSDEWVEFRVCEERTAALALCGRLRTGGCPAEFEARALSCAIETDYTVFVPGVLRHRANWIVAQVPISDGELEFLATGILSGEGGENAA